MRSLDPNPDVNELLHYNGAKRPKPPPMPLPGTGRNVPYSPRPPRDLTDVEYPTAWPGIVAALAFLFVIATIALVGVK